LCVVGSGVVVVVVVVVVGSIFCWYWEGEQLLLLLGGIESLWYCKLKSCAYFISKWRWLRYFTISWLFLCWLQSIIITLGLAVHKDTSENVANKLLFSPQQLQELNLVISETNFLN